MLMLIYKKIIEYFYYFFFVVFLALECFGCLEVDAFGLFSSKPLASSRVIFFGSRSFGIFALFGLPRPFPEAGFIAGPLIYGPNGPIIIFISPQSEIIEAFFFS